MQPSEPLAPDRVILSLNGGSSSIRFGLYRSAGHAASGTQQALERVLHGKIDRIGMSYARLQFTTGDGKATDLACEAPTAAAAVSVLLDWLAQRGVVDTLRGIGHRIVHGMGRTQPARLTPALLAELKALQPVDPDHSPGEIELIEACLLRAPTVAQVVCFDTAFHHNMPAVAKLLAVPRRLQDKGVQRYGFHGLSYDYLMQELARTAGAAVAQGKVVLAHLGNGASMTAVKWGHSVDTSMGFTPASGLPMGTRAGDLDPGLGPYLHRTQGMSPRAFDAMVNRESGLLGVSGSSSDMQDLLKAEAADPRAAQAVALFCYQAKKMLGSYAAALGGLDTLVFAGGIGENAPLVRERICAGLEFLGLTLDSARNHAAPQAGARVISSPDSRVAVHVIPTHEELMVARAVDAVLGVPLGPEAGTSS